MAATWQSLHLRLYPRWWANGQLEGARDLWLDARGGAPKDYPEAQNILLDLPGRTKDCLDERGEAPNIRYHMYCLDKQVVEQLEVAPQYSHPNGYVPSAVPPNFWNQGDPNALAMANTVQGPPGMFAAPPWPGMCGGPFGTPSSVHPASDAAFHGGFPLPSSQGSSSHANEMHIQALSTVYVQQALQLQQLQVQLQQAQLHSLMMMQIPQQPLGIAPPPLGTTPQPPPPGPPSIGALPPLTPTHSCGPSRRRTPTAYCLPLTTAFPTTSTATATHCTRTTPSRWAKSS
eukprot:gene27349-4648_t